MSRPKKEPRELTAEEKEQKAAYFRAAVKKSAEKRDRINVMLPKGTIDRINALGLKSNALARELILAELERLERAKK